MTLGESIRASRKRKGLTQKELGELCGINEVQIRRYELGGKNSNPKIETLKKIATALDEPLWNFVGPGDETKYSDDDWLNDCLLTQNQLDVWQFVFKEYLNRTDGEEIFSVLGYYDALDENEKIALKQILRSFPILNEDGCFEAAKRVSELTCIKSYIKDEFLDIDK